MRPAEACSKKGRIRQDTYQAVLSDHSSCPDNEDWSGCQEAASCSGQLENLASSDAFLGVILVLICTKWKQGGRWRIEKRKGFGIGSVARKQMSSSQPAPSRV